MGFFDTKKVHSVNTTVTRLIEDDHIHSSIPPSVIGSIMRNDEQIVENVLEGLISGIGIRAHRMYEYAGKKYSFGRPSDLQQHSGQGDEIVSQLIISEVGEGTVISYSEFGPLNNMHMGWSSLVADYGYKSSTNTLDTLSALKGATVYLMDMQLVATASTMEEITIDGMVHWGAYPNAGYTPTRTVSAISNQVLPSSVIVDPLATEDALLVTYQWVVSTATTIEGIATTTDVVHEESLLTPLLDNSDDDYFQVRYIHQGEANYWTYKYGAGTYPYLDSIYESEVTPFGSYFPFAYFRYANTSMGYSPTSPEYKTSKRLVKYLGMDYGDMLDSINENPDIDQVESAMMMMAVPATTSNQFEQRYLFDFFERVYLNAKGTPPDDVSILTPALRSAFNRVVADDSVPRINYTIQDSRFTMIIGCNSIHLKTRAGVVATVGEYASQYIKKETVVAYQEWDDILQEMVDRTHIVFIPTHYYRRQISDSVYVEIEVNRLRSLYYVWGGMVSVGDETDPTLLIPLDYSITSGYPISDREILYARSLHLVFNSHTITKIKWYQKGAFKIILIIIMLVVAYFTGYFDPYLLAIAAGGTALVTAIITAILQYIVVSLLVKLFIKIVGVKAAFLVAIVAVIAAAYGVIDAGSISGAPWASQLLQASTGLMQGVGDAIQQGMLELQKEAVAFGAFAEAQTKLLDTANELLETNSILSPFVIFGESPDDFYNRTVHSGNIGLLGIDAISYFVDTALTLPKLSDNIGTY